MSFCSFSTNKKVKNFTELSNIFFVDYLSDAPGDYVKVYLYGLYLCQNQDTQNSLEQFTKYFNFSKEDIFGAFAYWQEKGLVKIIDIEPFEIRYLDVIRNYEREKQILSGKYKNFCKDIQEIISGRMLSLIEFQTYMEFLESSAMQPSALLAIANYCTETQGKDIGYKYVLTVANDWLNKGITTQKETLSHINSINENNEVLKNLLSMFGTKRNANIDEINAFNFISTELGYNIETISQVGRNLKNKSKNPMQQLTNKFKKYYEMKLFSYDEIDTYEKQKEYFSSLAKIILKELGLYYDNIEPVIETYIIKWNNLSYDEDTLIQIAKLCFKSNIKSLEGMDQKIDKFFKLGLISLEAINAYIGEVISIDEQIKLILEKLKVSRQVNSTDRYMFNIWMNTYNVSNELLEYAIEKSIGVMQPMQYLNKILNHYNIMQIKTVDQAKEKDKMFESNQTIKKKEIKKNTNQRSYTTEELNAFFTNIDDIKF